MPVNTQKSSRFLILGKLQASSSPLKTEDDPPIDRRLLRIPLCLVSPGILGSTRRLFAYRKSRSDGRILWHPELRPGPVWAAPAWAGEAWIGEAWVVQAWVASGSAAILRTSQRYPNRLPGPQRLRRQPYAMLRRRPRPGARSVAAAAPVAGLAATPPTDAE